MLKRRREAQAEEKHTSTQETAQSSAINLQTEPETSISISISDSKRRVETPILPTPRGLPTSSAFFSSPPFVTSPLVISPLFVASPLFVTSRRWRDLPDPLLRHVATFFDIRDLVSFGKVSSPFRAVVKSPELAAVAPKLAEARAIRVQRYDKWQTAFHSDRERQKVEAKTKERVLMLHSYFVDAFVAFGFCVSLLLAPLALDQRIPIPVFVSTIPSLLGLTLALVSAADNFYLPYHNVVPKHYTKDLATSLLFHAPIPSIGMRVRLVVFLCLLFFTFLLALVRAATSHFPDWLVFLPLLLFFVCLIELGVHWCIRDGPTTHEDSNAMQVALVLVGFLMSLFCLMVMLKLAQRGAVAEWSWMTVHWPVFLLHAMFLLAGPFLWKASELFESCNNCVDGFATMCVMWLPLVPLFAFHILLSLRLDDTLQLSFLAIFGPVLGLLWISTCCVVRAHAWGSAFSTVGG